MILKKFLKKNNFVHRGAHNGAETDLTLCAITRPFLEIEPWNVNKKLFFFNFKNENAKKIFFFRGEFFFFFEKFLWGQIFLEWLRTLIFFLMDFFYKMKPSHLSQRWFYGWNLFSKNFLKKKYFWGGEGGGKNYFFIFETGEPLIF